MIKNTKYLVCVCLMMLPFHLQAENFGFTIEKVELQGAKRVTLSTILSYMPIKVGDTLTEKTSQKTLRDLFDTGFFKDVQLIRQGNTLIVFVDERPAIAELKYDGNKKVKSEDIDKAFDDLGMVRGQIFDDSVLDMIRQELQRVYYSIGRYGVKIDTKVIPLTRNRVKISVDIKEGESAKIRQINIVGNTIFEEEDLLSDFESGVPSFWAIFSSKDDYAQTKLSGDLEKLNSYYMDRGYINFKADSTQVTISPDKKDIYITIGVTEGDLYKVSGTKLAGKLADKEKIIQAIIDYSIRKGAYYSLRNVTYAEEEINSFLSNDGYAFSEVEVTPEIDEEKKEVELTFNVIPNQRVYVRRMRFKGNEMTLDSVYRRELRQLEGEWYKGALIERSKVRIQRLPFVEEVEVDKTQVLGSDNQVDVEYTVKERLSGSFNVQAGYSDLYKTSFSVGVTQNNLFGSGNSVALNLSTSRIIDRVNLSFNEPYYTDDQVGRSLSLFYTEVDTEKTSLSSYVQNTLGGGTSYNIPISEYSAISLGVSISENEITLPRSYYQYDENGDLVQDENGDPVLVTPVSDEILDFVRASGSEYELLSLTTGYFRDTRNRSIFPSSGSRHGVSLELVPGDDLQYYRLNYVAEHHFQVSPRTSFMFKYDIGYGDSQGELDGLPFFEKYISGGIQSFRGFDVRSIGPKDSRGRAYGGDFKTLGTLEYFLPPPGEKNSGTARISLFLDFGNVYARPKDFDTSEFRASFGVSARWLTPMGALTFALVKPFKYDKGKTEYFSPGYGRYLVDNDEPDTFQFTVGSSF